VTVQVLFLHRNQSWFIQKIVQIIFNYALSFTKIYDLSVNELLPNLIVFIIKLRSSVSCQYPELTGSLNLSGCVEEDINQFTNKIEIINKLGSFSNIFKKLLFL